MVGGKRMEFLENSHYAALEDKIVSFFYRDQTIRLQTIRPRFES